MKLIIILLALAAERFGHLGIYANRFNWLPNYLAMLRNTLAKTGVWKGIWGIILALLPILILVGLIYCGLHHILLGFPKFLFALIVLFYCLGPRDLYLDFEAYFIAQIQENKLTVTQALANIEVPAATNFVAREVTKAVFNQFNIRIFAVLFWFLVLGPVGAVLYRIVAEIRRISLDPFQGQLELAKGAELFLNILDWLPIRLAGLGYALMGDFIRGFSYWIKNLFTGLDKNKEFSEQSGLIALDLKDETATTASTMENKEALALVDRTTILFLVVIALFVLGAWIY